jgi:phosphoglucosamine mutase
MTALGALFGTDGIRGEAGLPPLDERSMRAFGAAVAHVLASRLGRPPRVVIGRDTRHSGPELLAWIAQGLRDGGASARSAGVVPTPAVSRLARHPDFDAGIVVSASHNPWRDNGVKVFSHLGTKLDDALELEVEREIARQVAGHADEAPCGTPPADEPALRRHHADALVARFAARGGLQGLSVVLDCAHGAASGLAGGVLLELGAKVTVLCEEPDGRNINEGCGSVHPDALARRVVSDAADAGIAFDGDADRCILVDDRGRLVDGDHVLLLCADDLIERGALRGGGVVGTVMSNFGLERALRSRGLVLVREKVGDRNVLERMQRDGFNLGGEPSGHVIFLDDEPTGDGQLTALSVLGIVKRRGRSLSELADALPKAPQVLVNVRVRERRPLEDVAGHAERVRSWSRRLGDEGRLVVRWSGTERLVRVMAEGSDAALVSACAEDIAEHLRLELGAA